MWSLSTTCPWLTIRGGTAIGAALELELKPGWTEGANLYGACVGAHGSKKTPNFPARSTARR